MKPIQCKLARVALGWGVRDLADVVKMSPNTISRLERGEQLLDRTTETVRAALEDGGVEFIDEGDGKGPGVRLRRPVG
jgi:transcriptional regulator with XRE-family HTH domain